MIDAHKIAAVLGLPPLPSQSSETIAALTWAREVVQKHLVTTYGVKDPEGVEELKSIEIGGIEQWLHIRGRNRNNPVLLMFHGGPGFGNIGYMDATQRPWEDYFTIVQWDQRQTGKSYYAADDKNNPLTVQQFINDAEDIIRYLRDYLKKEKIFLLGHSWGSVLGMHMVRRHPEFLYAYIGLGQVVSGMDNERVLFERLLSRARDAGEARLLEKLEAIGQYPDPKCPGKSFAEHSQFLRRELSNLFGEAFMRHVDFDDAITMLSVEKLISPHLTSTDHGNGIEGDDIALFRPPYAFTNEFLNNNLPEQIGSSFEVPIFFFTGRHDWQTPVSLSDQWFEKIDAPYKELLHFENSSHIVINEEPGKFLVALVEKVLPFAQGGSN